MNYSHLCMNADISTHNIYSNIICMYFLFLYSYTFIFLCIIFKKISFFKGINSNALIVARMFME